MTLGVGGLTAEQALATLSDMTADLPDIPPAEYHQRLERAQEQMRSRGIDCLVINAGSNLRYFSGTNWHASERLVCLLLPASGTPCYFLPHFERESFIDHWGLALPIVTWQEHEDPRQGVVDHLHRQQGGKPLTVGLCGSLDFATAGRFISQFPDWHFVSAEPVTTACRQQKSAGELAIIQRAMEMTLAVHQAAASILHEGISSEQVTAFIDQAHRKVGAGGSYFCIVLFAEATALPHGIKGWQTLNNNDMVLIDTGCKLMGYTSDITRSYVFGEANDRQRAIWQAEKAAQAAAFAAAQPGQPCEAVDRAARASLERAGLGPEYQLPGLPHRTGHGIGLDIHEAPYLVGGDTTPLATGMCFSNEPMICVPGEFGIRLEDHFYLNETGPCWFTQPSHSIDDPFGLAADHQAKSVTETARLQLQTLSLADADFILSIFNEAEVIRFTGNRKLRTLHDAKNYLCRSVFAMQEKQGFSLYLCRRREDNQPVGLAGLVKRPGMQHPEIAYAIADAHCGRGYAFEAANAVLIYARDHLAIDTLQGITHPENQASVHLLKKMGFEDKGLVQVPAIEGESRLFQLALA